MVELAFTFWSLKVEKWFAYKYINGSNIVNTVYVKNWTRPQCFENRQHLATCEQCVSYHNVVYTVCMKTIWTAIQHFLSLRIVGENRDLNSGILNLIIRAIEHTKHLI